MTEEEENEMEINIEAKYAGRTEKEFLNNISYAECLYILDTRNKYCNEIKDLSLLKLVDIISKLQADIDIKDKVIEKAFKYIDEHTYRDMEECEFGETNNLTCIKDCDTCIKQYFYKQVEKVGGEDE